MKTISQRKVLFALLTILLLLAACKGDSPTAPPPNTGGGNPPGSGNPPPTGVTIALSVTNPEPFVDATTTITATVTLNNQPVADGTAVELQISGLESAQFTDNNAKSILKTTVNGSTSVGLTAGSIGTATVTAYVNNVSRPIQVTFKQRAEEPEPVDETPVVTSMTPVFGRPQGGEPARITGEFFFSPVRVFFEANGQRKEALVTNVTATTIDIITPSINLPAAMQSAAATVQLIFGQGTANEVTIEAPTFTYRQELLTPVVSAMSPSQGPINGGTRATIFGDGFQSPVQVFLGNSGGPVWAQVQVVDVSFNQITIITPPARDLSPSASEPITGPVDLRIININSNTEVIEDNIFRYVAAVQITALSPTEGPFTGGTRIRIDGTGFDDPVAVSVAGVGASVISVTSSQIIAITNGAVPTSCTDVTGLVRVVNVENGNGADGPGFIYRVRAPVIVGLPGNRRVTEGSSFQITLANVGGASGPLTFTLGSVTVSGTPLSTNADGSINYSINVPLGAFTFPQIPCSSGAGTQRGELGGLSLTITNGLTTCTVTAAGFTVVPDDTSCVAPAPPELTQVTPTPPNCVNAGSVVAAGTANSTRPITFQNDGGSPLIVNFVSTSGPNAADFAVSPASITVAPGATGSFTVTYDPAAVGAATNTSANFTTNDPDEGSVSVCLTGTGT